MKNSKKLFSAITAIAMINLSLPQISFSAEAKSTSETSISKASSSAFELKYEPTRPRTFLLPPLVSFFLPGFDQWWEGQYLPGALYSGVYLGALGFTHMALKDPSLVGYDPRGIWLGIQTTHATGSMSAYHSFRTAVKSRQSNGDFRFLKHEESPTDLLLAPFQFNYFTRPTVYVGLPVTILSAFAIASLQGYKVSTNWKMPTQSDLFYSGAISYNAGVGEEALFRGWLMPVAMHYTNSEFVSNATTSLIFGAAHYRGRDLPIMQTLGGFYLGYLTQKNEWRLGESIFFHTWYDVAIFLISFSQSSPAEKSQAVFQVSPVSIPF